MQRLISPDPDLIDHTGVKNSANTQTNAESEICITCGFCCDGTLFGQANSGPGDTAESLVTIGLTPVNHSSGVTSGFSLPCPHFTGLCSIYNSARPSICGIFRCRLLRSVQRGKYSVTQALQIVRETKNLRDAVLPVLDAVHADAVAIVPRPEAGGRSMILRLGEVMPMAIRPEGAQLRDRYGKLLVTAFHLTSLLVNEFLPKSKEKDPAA
jgi:hypothetical protein